MPSCPQLHNCKNISVAPWPFRVYCFQRIRDYSALRISFSRKGDYCMRYYAVLLGTLIFSCATFAQEVTAGVYGTVLDSSASAVPRASITLRNLETGRTLQTHSDDSGNFVLTL